MKSDRLAGAQIIEAIRQPSSRVMVGQAATHHEVTVSKPVEFWESRILLSLPSTTGKGERLDYRFSGKTDIDSQRFVSAQCADLSSVS